MRARTRFSQLPNWRIFQHRVMGGSSSAKADTIGQDVEEETVQWTILLASISRWMRRMFAFSIAKAWWFARARPSRRRRRSPANWRKRQVVIALCSRPDEWRQSYSRVEPTRSARSLRREPAGLPGAQITRDPQDRSQRRARSGAFGSHRLLQARACEVAAGSCAPLFDHCPQEVGWPAG